MICLGSRFSFALCLLLDVHFSSDFPDIERGSLNELEIWSLTDLIENPQNDLSAPSKLQRTAGSASGTTNKLQNAFSSVSVPKVPEGHHPRDTTLREALRGNLPLRVVFRGLCGGLFFRGFCRGPRDVPRVVTLCLWPCGAVGSASATKREIYMGYKHPVLALYEYGKIWTEGISLIFWRENSLKPWTLKVATP